MPKGVYARKQVTQGYSDTSYLAKKLKTQAGFICQECGRSQPACKLRVSNTRVLCLKCLAAEEFGGTVLKVLPFLERARKRGLPLKGTHLRKWAKQGLIPKPKHGFLPTTLFPIVALLYHNRTLAVGTLRKLLESQSVEILTMRNTRTGLVETLTVIEEFPIVDLGDGQTYLCRRLFNGDIITRRKRHARVVRAENEKD